jgi:hypothetical protein
LSLGAATSSAEPPEGVESGFRFPFPERAHA